MYKLEKANDKKHKFIVTTPTGKKIKFGAYGYSDYTKHGDINRRNRYIERHKKNEDWSDKNSKGFYSRWLLWNKPTLKESIKDVKKFGMTIRYIS